MPLILGLVVAGVLMALSPGPAPPVPVAPRVAHR
jgi:hypothetical protein